MRRMVLAYAALTLVAPALLPAQSFLERMDVHGYGGWSFGRTVDNKTTNHFLFGHSRGDYSHSEFALNLSIAVNDRLKIDAQPFWHSGHHANQTASGMDYVFAEYRWSDAFALRAGQVKHPFGIYTEVFDVGTLRPFAALPQSVYGPTGFVGKAYSGVGFTGALYASGGWGVSYDVYGGGLEVVERDVGFQVLAQGPDTTGKTLNFAETKAFRDVVGGRLVMHTPVAGMSFGISGYTGTRPVAPVERRRTVYGAHAELLTDHWSLRAEGAHQNAKEGRTIDGAYIEAAYRLTREWQVAALYNTLDAELDGVSAVDIARAPSLLRHKERGVALNYWFTPNFVVKASYHEVDGNHFAQPEPVRVRSVVAGNALRTRTELVLLGAQLSF